MFKFLSECLLYETMVELWESSPLPSSYSMVQNDMTAYTTKKEKCQARAGILIAWPESLALNLYQYSITAIEYFDMLIFFSCVQGVKNLLVGGILSVLSYGPLQTIIHRVGNLDLFI